MLGFAEPFSGGLKACRGPLSYEMRRWRRTNVGTNKTDVPVHPSEGTQHDCGTKSAYRFALVTAGVRRVAAGRQPGNRASAVSGSTASTAPGREKSCKARTRPSGRPIQPAVPVSGAPQMGIKMHE